MPSSHPIPTIAALALSLYASDRRVERLPVVTEHVGTVSLPPMREIHAPIAPAFITLTIGGDL